MRVVQLSDYPSDHLARAREQRDAAGRRAQARHDAELAAHNRRVARARATRDRARAQRRWLAWLRAALAVRGAARSAPRPPKAASPSTDEEQILAAGVAGEQLVA